MYKLMAMDGGNISMMIGYILYPVSITVDNLEDVHHWTGIILHITTWLFIIGGGIWKLWKANKKKK